MVDRRNAENEGADNVTGAFAYEGLDRVIHERARLGIMSSLITHPEGLYFGDLKDLCSLTDGNLNRHLKVLHEADLVDVQKRRRGKRSQTVCRVTEEGRKQFLDYVRELEKVITDAGSAAAELLGFCSLQT